MITLNLEILENAPTQFTNHDYDSMMVFDGKLCMGGEGGIDVLDESGSDNGTAISAWAKLANTDFGTARKKRLRKVYVTYEAYTTGMSVDAFFDELLAYTKSLVPTNGVQETARVDCERSGYGSTVTLKFNNVSGSDFTLRAIEVTPIILHGKPSGD